MKADILVKEAINARKHAYAEYSHYTVGAALLGENDTIYTGCNIENAALSPTICAERTAFHTAIASGERKFLAIAIVGGKQDKDELEFCFPCGTCRQVMEEFCDSNFEIIVAKNENDYAVYTLKELFPHGFHPKDVQK